MGLQDTYNTIMGTKEVSVLLLGLEDAGKTAILDKFNFDQNKKSKSDYDVLHLDVRFKNCCFKILDIGRQDKMLELWRSYFKNAQVIIYVIDSTNGENLIKSKRELTQIFHRRRKELENTILYVLANKKDLPNSMEITEIIDILNLYSFRNHSWHIQPTCAINGEGLYESLEWLSNQLNNK